MLEKAVALAYDERHRAPRLVARGKKQWAKKMVKIAESYGIPLLQNGEMVETLYPFEPEQCIPEDLYQAVAEIYRFVWSLRERP